MDKEDFKNELPMFGLYLKQLLCDEKVGGEKRWLDNLLKHYKNDELIFSKAVSGKNTILCEVKISVIE